MVNVNNTKSQKNYPPILPISFFGPPCIQWWIQDFNLMGLIFIISPLNPLHFWNDVFKMCLLKFWWYFTYMLHVKIRGFSWTHSLLATSATACNEGSDILAMLPFYESGTSVYFISQFTTSLLVHFLAYIIWGPKSSPFLDTNLTGYCYASFSQTSQPQYEVKHHQQ